MPKWLRRIWLVGGLVLIAAAAALLTGAAAATDYDPADDESLRVDRHSEFTDPSIVPPAWPANLPIPMHERPGKRFLIVIDNVAGGAIHIREYAEQPPADGASAPEYQDLPPLGTVITPVTAVNPRGFTASGWAKPGTVCATAVNAIHLKTDHDYSTGRGVIFSLLPIEQAEIDPKNYKSYISHETSLQTDIKAGTGIFGGRWAPLVGSTLCWRPAGTQEAYAPVEPGWVPHAGDTLVIDVRRRKYNPEYIEFENSYGGLIWIKELGEDPYPIGQVLKPVVGVGRFLGTQYAEIGRIRAAHPGVICISTSPKGTIGGFQIIPRDHAMSPEMIYTRYKTQWMVVGPLWALDPSWEGLPPLFSDYLYPAYIPAVDEYGDPNDAVSAMEIYLGRFTVRGRYSDSDDPEEYVLLHEADYLNNYALKNLTHVRIYFPRM